MSTPASRNSSIPARYLLPGTVMLVTLVLLGLGWFYLQSAFFKADMSRILSRAIGYPVSLRGPLQIQWGRVARIRATDVEIASGPGFAKNFAQARQIQTSMALWPWLREHKLVLGPIRIDGAVIHVLRNPAGRDNWRELINRLTRPGKGPPLLRTAGPIHMPAARVVWEDQMKGRVMHFSDMDMQTGTLRPGEIFPLDIGGRWQGFQSQGKMRFTAGVQMPLAPKPLIFEQPRLHVATRDVHWTPRALPLQLRLEAPQLMPLKSGWWRAGQTQAQIDQAGRRAWMRGDVAFQYQTGELNIENMQADLGAAMRARGRVQIRRLYQLDGWRLQARLPFFDPRRFARYWRLPLPAMHDPRALSRARFALTLAQQGRDWQWRLSDGLMDQSRIQGSGVIRFQPLALRFTLFLDQMNIDKYFPASTGVVARASTQLSLPDQLRAWPVAGELRLARFRTGRMSGRNLLVRLGYGDGRWQFP